MCRRSISRSETFNVVAIRLQKARNGDGKDRQLNEYVTPPGAYVSGYDHKYIDVLGFSVSRQQSKWSITVIIDQRRVSSSVGPPRNRPFPRRRAAAAGRRRSTVQRSESRYGTRYSYRYVHGYSKLQPHKPITMMVPTLPVRTNTHYSTGITHPLP